MTKYSIGAVDYSSNQGTKAIQSGTAALCVIGLIAFALLGIAFVVDHADSNVDRSRFRRDTYSSQFFTAIYKGDEEIIQDPQLRDFYLDLIEVDKYLEETKTQSPDNALMPASLAKISVVEEDYGNMCEYFHHWGVEQTEEGDCEGEGSPSGLFLDEYHLAKSGESEWIDFVPVKSNYAFGGIFSLSTQVYVLFAYLVAQVVAAIVTSITGSGERNYNTRRMSYGYLPRKIEVFFASIILPWLPIYAYIVNRPVRRDKQRKQELFNKKRYKNEILAIREKIFRLENIDKTLQTKDVKAALKVLREVLADLENEDTALEQQTITYLAKDYTKEALEAKQGAEAYRQARDELSQL